MRYGWPRTGNAQVSVRVLIEPGCMQTGLRTQVKLTACRIQADQRKRVVWLEHQAWYAEAPKSEAAKPRKQWVPERCGSEAIRENSQLSIIPYAAPNSS
jgi:hypothetical protein